MWTLNVALQPDPKVKSQWDELYGEPLMEYFVTPQEARDPKDGSHIRNHHAFSRCMSVHYSRLQIYRVAVLDPLVFACALPKNQWI